MFMGIILKTNENHCQMGGDGQPGLRARRRVWAVLVVNRFRVAEDETLAFAEDLAAAHALLAAKGGYLGGAAGRNVDDPSLWVLQTRWVDVGSYRRALSAYDVKLGAVPLLSRALDEPSAYEVLGEGGAAGLNRARPRGSS
jgi:quinol monooxygenase YgiN